MICICFRARLPALYADFRPQRTLNPDGYRANVSTWLEALSQLAADGILSRQIPDCSVFVLDANESLPKYLESNQFGQPLAIGGVIRDAVDERKLMPVQPFLQHRGSIYHRGWSGLPWNVMSWTLRQFGVSSIGNEEDRIPKGRYVIVHNVEAASEKFKAKSASRVSRFDRVFTRIHFQNTLASEVIGNERLTDDDLDILLTYLARDKSLIDYDGRIIRIRHPTDELDIQDEDAAIASLKELAANLTHQTDILNDKITGLHQEAKDAIQRNNRVAAMAALKSRKLAESTLTKRYTILSQLEEVAAKLEQASDQVQMVKVMQSSANALQSLNSQVGGGDKVEAMMEQIRQQMMETDEVSAIMAQSTGEPVDETEIEEELARLETGQGEQDTAGVKRKADQKAEQEQSQPYNLPDPPTASPKTKEGSETPILTTEIENLSLE